MAYPPTVPANTRNDSTALLSNHAADHNAISNALTDIINELGTNPSGTSASLTALLDLIDPADAIIAVGGATAPAGWGLCDGSAVSRATYAATFARIGTTYGAGDGSTTFNLPDLRSKFIAGKGTATWSNALAETGGSKDAVVVSHTHTGPSHSHSFSATTSTDGAHTHPHGDGYNAGSQSPLGVGNSWMFVGGATVPNTGSGGFHNHSVSGTTGAAGTDSTSSTGSSGTDANLPPYLTLNYCIRLR